MLDIDCLFPCPIPAGSIERRLRILMIFYHFKRHLQMPLRLHECTHNAERSYRLAVFGDESGDNGVIGALSGCDAVAAALIEVKARSTVVNGDTRIRDNDARAEAVEIRLNIRNRQSGGQPEAASPYRR